MFKNKWTPLCGVALEARFVLAQESDAATFQRLLNICRRAFDRHPDMRIMAISTTDLALQNRMMMRQLKACPHLEVTLETGFGRSARIDDRMRCATAFDMQAARTMARLTSNVLRVLSLCL